jgi:hypothetical protein
MLWFLVGFPLIAAWGLYSGDIYWQDAAKVGIPWLVFVLGFFLYPPLIIPCIIGLLLCTIWLAAMVFGTDFLMKNRY